MTFSDDEESIAFEGTFRKLIELFSRIARQMQKGLMEEMVGALLPKDVLSKAAVVQARMMADTKSKILQSGDSLPAGEIAKLARYGEKNPGAQANRWKKDGAIFAIRRKGADYFPLYALNPDEKYHPYKSIAEILRIFGNSKTGWGTAFWFAGLNSFLDARRPQDLLAGDPALVIAAAKDEVEGVRHGYGIF